MKKILFYIILLSSLNVVSQELNCQVTVNSDRIQGTNKQRFITLQNAINQFLNNTTWTNIEYEVDERIQANVNILLLEEIGSDQFTATIQVQSRRPVFGSEFYTTLLNFKDNRFQFKYTEFEPLIFNEQSFTSNLVSTLSFYAYLIIGLDQDSFSRLGGNLSFQKARKITELTQNMGFKGWDPASNRTNRYWIIENILSNSYSDARLAFYSYHREGLDMMSDDVEKGKQNIFKAIELLSKVDVNRPNQNYIQNLLDAKSDEIVDIFKNGPEVNKEELKSFLNKMSPSRQVIWSKI